MIRAIFAAAALAGLISGCVVHSHGPGHHRVYGPAVYFDAGHVHSVECGHFHHGGYWYVHQGHRHGPGCGHLFRSGIWIVAD